MVAPGTTWLWLCIMVSSATVSPEWTRSTGGWALSNQPHCVVSSVAGNRCSFLPFGKAATRRLESAGPTPGYPLAIVAVGGNCGAAAAGAAAGAVAAGAGAAGVVAAGAGAVGGGAGGGVCA